MILFNKKTPQSLGSLYPFIVTKKNFKEWDIRNFYEGITPKLSTIIFDCYTLKKFKLISKKIKKVLHNSSNP